MIYLHLFKTQQEHDNIYNCSSEEYIEPWVGYVEQTDSVSFNMPPCPPDYTKEYFTIELLQSGKITNGYLGHSIDYSANDGETWTIMRENEETPIYDAGQKILMRSTSPMVEETNENFGFTVNAPFNVSGNILSLNYGENFTEHTTFDGWANWICGGLFANSQVVSAENLILPAPSMSSHYQAMFSGCTQLIAAPQLTGTTLQQKCYHRMFKGCTALTTAPELPALSIPKSAYTEMFSGCTSLNYIKAMFTTTPSTRYTQNWVSGVASSGTFVKNSAASWNVRGVNGIPTGWNVETAET